MDVRQLQIFLHLSGSLHFAKTAQAMHVSPSALSRIIQRLEQNCGTELLQRDNRKVQLTKAGQTFRVFCESVVAQWQQTLSDINQHADQLQGELSIYCSVTASFSHLPALLDTFRANYPQVEIKLSTGDPAIATAKVISGEVDVAIAINSTDFNHKELHFSAIDQLPMVMITPAVQGLNSIDDIDWQSQKLIWPESGPTRVAIQQWLSEHKITPDIYGSVAGNEAIVSMVSLGFGIGIVPQVVVDNIKSQQRINVFPLPETGYLPLGLCCFKSNHSKPLVRALFQQIR